jgi:ATP diphosphatase
MQALERLLSIMARLRDPDRGCPWDIEQSFATIAPHTIEEAYEVDDAIRRGDMEALREELGDLLLQVVFHAQMANEQGLFDFAAVAETLADKLVRRHPHVFGDADVKSADEQLRAWEDLKARERAEKSAAAPSALDGVAMALPALLRAQKLVRRAERAGLAATPAATEDAWHAYRATPSEASLGALLLALCGESARVAIDAERALREASEEFARVARAGEPGSPRAESKRNGDDARRALAATKLE